MMEKDKRLFIGIGFSEKLTTALEPWIRKLRKTADHKETHLKWVPRENYHVTLVFLGNTPKSAISEISEKMNLVAARHSKFQLKIREVGAFPSPAQARVITVGVQRSQAILDLQSDLENELQVPGDREYAPHLTLARLKNPKSCRDLLSPFQHLDLGKQEVFEITLFESILAGPFPVYRKLFTAPLSQPSPSSET